MAPPASPRLRVLHVSPAHSPTDPRIVQKQTVALARHYDVWCALPGARPTRSSEVRFVGLPYFRLLWQRILFCHPLILWHILRIRPAILHLYMPELLPVGFLARWFGVRVIYEVQENLYQKMPIKKINNARLFQRLFRWFDRLARQRFSLIFTEDSYLEEYQNLVQPFAVIHNFPDVSTLARYQKPYRSVAGGRPEFFYVGVLSPERALDTMVQATALLKKEFPAIRLHLFGRCTMSEAELSQLPGFSEVRENLIFYGQTDHAVAMPYAARCVAGLAVLKPVGDYPGSYPTKLFEYMTLGLPVITSDFPLYRNIVEDTRCGFCIDPYDAPQLAEKMCYLIQHPAEAADMGERGRQAVLTTFNWETEQRLLLTFYRKIEPNQ